jgi:2-polyprenyl-3-methyl-5-hydroxy-6-metoxy-1,4-benzoquinol methylase
MSELETTGIHREQIDYDPSRYLDVETVEDAIGVILNETEGLTSIDRWNIETPAIMALIENYIDPDSIVIDYGCGIGRLTKPLVEIGCRVVGIDISAKMRALATAYVDHSRFVAMAPALFRDVTREGWFDAVVAIWTFQHCEDLDEAVEDVFYALSMGGRLIVVNDIKRAIPVADGAWADDGLDVHAMLLEHFRLIEKGQLDVTVAPGWMRDGTFWAVYEK